jgi:ribosomal protein L21E
MQDRTIEISAKTWNLRLILFEIQGMIALGTYMKTYRVGDIVDIKANGAVQKGVRSPALQIHKQSVARRKDPLQD